MEGGGLPIDSRVTVSYIQSKLKKYRSHPPIQKKKLLPPIHGLVGLVLMGIVFGSTVGLWGNP